MSELITKKKAVDEFYILLFFFSSFGSCQPVQVTCKFYGKFQTDKKFDKQRIDYFYEYFI